MRFSGRFKRLTWSQRFMLASLVVLVAGMFGMGWWVGQEIMNSVVHQSAANTSLYVSSMVEPELQELADGDTLTPEHEAALARLLEANSPGQHITAVKVWDKQGRVVYATDRENIGLVFPPDDDLARALRGWVASGISTLNKPENALDHDRGQRRLETYTPVRRIASSEIIAAVEFYQTVEGLDRDIAAAQRRSWLIVGAATVGMYALLAGFVRRASDTIHRQQGELGQQVTALKELLAQNEELHERVRRAARRTTALNERFLRRISAELHDGPAQDLGLALLRLDQLGPEAEPPQAAPAAVLPDYQVVESSLQHALKEIREISAGMGLPELENVSLVETARRAARAHERRTNTPVALSVNGVPDDAPLPVKITVYRIIQEALSNAYRHAGGAGQHVHLSTAEGRLELVVADQGPGFDERQADGWDEHLGLVGMRERVESLGGIFRIESQMGSGTRVIAELPLEARPGSYER